MTGYSLDGRGNRKSYGLTPCIDPRRSKVAVNTMTANDVAQAIQIPGPTASATPVATPIRSSAARNAHWPTSWQVDPSQNRTKHALETPSNCAATSSQNTVDKSIPFIGGRFLSLPIIYVAGYFKNIDSVRPDPLRGLISPSDV